MSPRLFGTGLKESQSVSETVWDRSEKGVLLTFLGFILERTAHISSAFLHGIVEVQLVFLVLVSPVEVLGGYQVGVR